jgi:6-pyruvoyltetrahydropterin/6-carboxytetrahydropterin synthase
MLSLTKSFKFEAAHFLHNYDGLCKNIHGHSYELHVTVTSLKNKENGMVMDFKQLKNIVNQSAIDYLDHAVLINEKNSKLKWVELYEGKLFYSKGEPSAENLIEDIVNRIKRQLPAGIKLNHARLYETSSSWADWED